MLRFRRAWWAFWTVAWALLAVASIFETVHRARAAQYGALAVYFVLVFAFTWGAAATTTLFRRVPRC